MNCMLSYCNLILTPLSYIQTALIILVFEKLTARLFDTCERHGCINTVVTVDLNCATLSWSELSLFCVQVLVMSSQSERSSNPAARKSKPVNEAPLPPRGKAG
jgi:hypothetical protein